MLTKKTNYYLAVFSMAAMLLSCNNKADKKDSSTVTDSSITVVNGQNKAEPKLVCKDMGEDSLATPHYDVILLADGKETKISSVNSCAEIPKSNFKNYDIPDNALSAVGGWWAGSGSYFYVTSRDGKYLVFEGWQEETQNEKGYHWKEISQ